MKPREMEAINAVSISFPREICKLYYEEKEVRHSKE